MDNCKILRRRFGRPARSETLKEPLKKIFKMNRNHRKRVAAKTWLETRKRITRSFLYQMASKEIKAKLFDKLYSELYKSAVKTYIQKRQELLDQEDILVSHAGRVQQRRRPRNTARRTNATLSNIKVRLNGAVIKNHPDPSSTVDRPWNNVILSFNATPGNVTLSSISVAFANQVGAGANTPVLDFRFRSVRAWETSGANIGLTLYDLAQTDTDPYRTGHDEPGRNHWANIGLMWNTTHQSVIFASGTATTPIFALASSAVTPSTVVHLEMLWRFAGPVNPSKFINSQLTPTSYTMPYLTDSTVSTDETSTPIHNNHDAQTALCTVNKQNLQ